MSDTYSEQYQKFLSKLVKARKDAGHSQKDVADKIGKPQSYISKCESGERRVDFVELLQIAAIYKKPLTYFVGGTDAEN